MNKMIRITSFMIGGFVKRDNNSKLNIVPYIIIGILCLMIIAGGYVHLRMVNNQWTRIDTVLDRICSIDTRKATFVSTSRDTIMNINPKLDIIEAVVVLETIYDCSETFDIDAKLILAVINQESDFCIYARGTSGEKGLMQIMPGTADMVARYLHMRDYDLFDIVDNITMGTAYLSILRTYHKDRIALASYNAGKNIKAGYGYADQVLEKTIYWGLITP